MDKIKRFIDCYLPTDACNFKCHYCYIGQKRKFKNRSNPFDRDPKIIRAALSKKRLGGTCLINICASGETLIPPQITRTIYELLSEGHYVMIVTNGSIRNRIQEICSFDAELLKHLFFKFSLHYLELKRQGILELFASNVRMVKEAGISFTVEITPNDELEQFIPELKEYCMQNFGSLCHVTIPRDERTPGFELLSAHNWNDFLEIWSQFNSNFFEFKTTTFNIKRKEFCYAGDWSFTLNLQSGEYRKCTYENVLGNIYDDIDSPLFFEAVGRNCRMAHCYNSHAYLTLGCIPNLDTPTMAEIRNRKCEDGTEWLAPDFKAFTSQKLRDGNHIYSTSEILKVEYVSHKAKLAKTKAIIWGKLKGKLKSVLK